MAHGPLVLLLQAISPLCIEVKDLKGFSNVMLKVLYIYISV